MTELIAGAVGTVLGALLGGGFAVAASHIQAKGARAQAEAALGAAEHQAEAAYLQWMRSDKTNAYAALITESLLIDEYIEAMARTAGHIRGSEFLVLKDAARSLRHIRLPVEVIGLHDVHDTCEAAASLGTRAVRSFEVAATAREENQLTREYLTIILGDIHRARVAFRDLVQPAAPTTSITAAP